jgi:hypothetical protein
MERPVHYHVHDQSHLGLIHDKETACDEQYALAYTCIIECWNILYRAQKSAAYRQCDS